MLYRVQVKASTLNWIGNETGSCIVKKILRANNNNSNDDLHKNIVSLVFVARFTAAGKK